MHAASLPGLTEWRWRMPPPVALPSEIIAIAKNAVKAYRAQRGRPTYQGAAVVSFQYLPRNVVMCTPYPVPTLQPARRAL